MLTCQACFAVSARNSRIHHHSISNCKPVGFSTHILDLSSKIRSTNMRKLTWTQLAGAQTAARRVEREIEIMSGILETTLRFAIEESAASVHTDQSAKERYGDAQLVYLGRNRSTSVSGYYLEDQGVAFVVKTGRIANQQLVDPSTGEIKFQLRNVVARGFAGKQPGSKAGKTTLFVGCGLPCHGAAGCARMPRSKRGSAWGPVAPPVFKTDVGR